MYYILYKSIRKFNIYMKFRLSLLCSFNLINSKMQFTNSLNFYVSTYRYIINIFRNWSFSNKAPGVCSSLVNCEIDSAAQTGRIAVAVLLSLANDVLPCAILPQSPLLLLLVYWRRNSRHPSRIITLCRVGSWGLC